MKRRFSGLIPAILASGAAARIDISTLPKGAWKTHSGFAPVAKEEVHSLKSQKIAGTKTLAIETDSGKMFSVGQGEAEVFAADYLKDLGYTVTSPRAQT